MDNNKKTFLVILLATILAFLAVFFITKSTKPQKDFDNVPTIKENIIEETETKIEESKVENKPVVQLNQKPQKQIQSPKLEDIKLEKLVVEENPEITTKPIEPEIDNGIKKIEGTNIIEVTREFKIDTPAKYSFK